MAKNLPATAGDTGDLGSIPESERSPGGGNDNPFQYPCLENHMDRGAWWAIVYKVPEAWTPLSIETPSVEPTRLKCCCDDRMKPLKDFPNDLAGKEPRRCSCCLVAQSCQSLCDPMYHSPPGSSILGILQARILEWVAISFRRWLNEVNSGRNREGRRR